MEIQQDQEDISDYKAYLKAWKRFMQVQEVERLSNKDIMTWYIWWIREFNCEPWPLTPPRA